VPYSVTIDPGVLAAILSWGLPKTLHAIIVHHLTKVLPGDPDQHLAENVLLAHTYACPLNLDDTRPGREGRQLHLRFIVYRDDPGHALNVLAGRIAEEEPEQE
jgi:hypothetical protein